MPTFLHPTEVDDMLRYKPGTARRLARRGELPHIKLPRGDIRFDADEIQKLIDAGRVPASSGANGPGVAR